MQFKAIEVLRDGVRFALRSRTAETVWLCLFDEEGEREEARLEMERGAEGLFSLAVPGARPGVRFGIRADGPYDPGRGMWFDPDKLLVHPWATRIDRRWRHDPRLASPRAQGGDTAPLVPKAIVENLRDSHPPGACFREGGLIYEINVRGFSMLHPDVPERDRGTLAALRSPSVISHLKKLGVSAVELMPVVAWIDERHLPGLGLSNAWGYNPVAPMAIDPRLAPRGIADLRDTADALREENIGVILDIVLNHTGESDIHGPTLSLRGIDNLSSYRHLRDDPGRLVNDTGCGNTLACDHPDIRELMLATLRHFVLHGGVDGFRFDLAPVLGRGEHGFDPHARTLQAICEDAVLADRVLVAEPWDIGPGGYQLGRFPDRFLEWNDRYRDGVRRFWRGDAGLAPELATRLSGSSDLFAGERTRTVNFIASHDGFTLADLVSYSRRHNEANGEENRDGHGENFSWNNGAEGPSTDPAVWDARRSDLEALLATLFLSKGTILLTAGDEFGRTQNGNNNAYAQDNETTWIDWEGRDRELEAFAMRMAELRATIEPLQDGGFYSAEPGASGQTGAQWFDETGVPLEGDAWHDPGLDCFQLVVATGYEDEPRVALLFNRRRGPARFELPARQGHFWMVRREEAAEAGVPGRTVGIALELVRGE